MQRGRASTVHSTQQSTLLPAPTSHLPKRKRKAISFFFSSAALWLEPANSPVGLPAIQGISCIQHHRKALLMQWFFQIQAPTLTPTTVLPHSSNQAAKSPQWACDASRKHNTPVILQDLEDMALQEISVPHLAGAAVLQGCDWREDWNYQPLGPLVSSWQHPENISSCKPWKNSCGGFPIPGVDTCPWAFEQLDLVLTGSDGSHFCPKSIGVTL